MRRGSDPKAFIKGDRDRDRPDSSGGGGGGYHPAGQHPFAGVFREKRAPQPAAAATPAAASSHNNERAESTPAAVSSATIIAGRSQHDVAPAAAGGHVMNSHPEGEGAGGAGAGSPIAASQPQPQQHYAGAGELAAGGGGGGGGGHRRRHHHSHPPPPQVQQSQQPGSSSAAPYATPNGHASASASAASGAAAGPNPVINKHLDFLASTERNNQAGVRRRRKSPFNYRQLLQTMQSERADLESRYSQTQAEVVRLHQLTLEQQNRAAAAQQQALTQQNIKATRSRIQHTFLNLSSWLLIVVVILLCYYNYLMFAPHLSAIFFAILWSIFLHRPQRWLLGFFALVDSHIESFRYRLYILSAFVFIGVGFFSPLLVVLGLLLLFLLWTLLLFGDRRSVTALVLVTAVALVLAFPLFFFLKTCVDESQKIGERVSAFIEENAEFHAIVDDFGASRTYLWIRSYAESWGWEVPAFDSKALRGVLIDSVGKMGHSVTIVLGGVLDVVSNLGRFVVAVVTFMSCLWYFLESGHSLISTVGVLSPFSPDDNAKLTASLVRSVFRIFVCSVLVALLHMVVTYVSFSVVGIDLCLILSFISGFAALVPVFSSWIVWLPASVGLFLMGQNMNAAIVAGVQLILNLYIDPLIYSHIPGNTYVIGMSIIMGFYVFGSIGVLLGPLITGLSVTVLDIYREYKELPQYTGSSRPQTGDTSAGSTSSGGAFTTTPLHPSSAGNLVTPESHHQPPSHFRRTSFFGDSDLTPAPVSISSGPADTPLFLRQRTSPML